MCVASALPVLPATSLALQANFSKVVIKFYDEKKRLISKVLVADFLAHFDGSLPEGSSIFQVEELIAFGLTELVGRMGYEGAIAFYKALSVSGVPDNYYGVRLSGRGGVSAATGSNGITNFYQFPLVKFIQKIKNNASFVVTQTPVSSNVEILRAASLFGGLLGNALPTIIRSYSQKAKGTYATTGDATGSDSDNGSDNGSDDEESGTPSITDAISEAVGALVVTTAPGVASTVKP